MMGCQLYSNKGNILRLGQMHDQERIQLLPFGMFPTTSKHRFGEMGLFASEALSSISTALTTAEKCGK